ncbi:MAG: trigger factor [Planctomycetaceae bacterium]
MAENEQLDDSSEETTALLEGQEEVAGMELGVEIQDVGPCMKHVKVTVPRAEIDKVLETEVSGLLDKAEVPGFRPGRVPEALIRKRFKTELAEKVKQQVLMLSLDQLSKDNKLDPINEPTLDVDGIEIPEEGDFEYEFDVEVRPQFDLPEYKGLTIERPVREVSDDDVAEYTEAYLEQYAELVPVDEPAQAGDQVIVDVVFEQDGKLVQKFDELSVRVRPTLRFHDVEIADFDKLIVGAKADDVREVEVTVSMESNKISMRGTTLQAKFTILDVKRLQRPELNEEFFTRIGIESEEALQGEFRSMLNRQVTYAQRQSTRSQVLEKITSAADWDLPEELVNKQVENAMRRETLELRQSGFTTPQIRAKEAELRQKSLSTTRKNLKEHFVLDRIANEEGIEVNYQDIDTEISIMAMQNGENYRRVRARLEKSGMIENLEAQIRERKAVDVVLKHAKFVDVPLPPFMETNVEAVKRSVCSDVAQVDDDQDDEAGDDN